MNRASLFIMVISFCIKLDICTVPNDQSSIPSFSYQQTQDNVLVKIQELTPTHYQQLGGHAPLSTGLMYLHLSITNNSTHTIILNPADIYLPLYFDAHSSLPPLDNNNTSVQYQSPSCFLSSHLIYLVSSTCIVGGSFLIFGLPGLLVSGALMVAGFPFISSFLTQSSWDNPCTTSTPQAPNILTELSLIMPKQQFDTILTVEKELFHLPFSIKLIPDNSSSHSYYEFTVQ